MKPGDKNRNTQRLLRITEARGTDHNSYVWILKCGACGHIYGCNNTDAFQRKCPACQGGKPGLEIPVERDGENWSRDEHIIAFNLYSQIPFGSIHMRNPQVIELAALLGRKIGSVSYKLANFARLDPALKARGIGGMKRGAKGEAAVWNEFADHPEQLAFESARLLAETLGQSIEEIAEIEVHDLPPPGVEREAIVRLRVNQCFFRRRVLSAYQYRCCVTGLPIQPLLVASHIVPWATDAANRLNPRNGLCLNALHDRAFDRGLMFVDENLRVRFSTQTRDAARAGTEWLLAFDGCELILPPNFSPDAALLAQHRERWRSAA